MRRSSLRSASVVTACILAAGCASREVERAAVLPFHVAVIPVDVLQVEQTSLQEGKETDVTLTFEAAPFSRTLTSTLGERFARATLLEPPHEVSQDASETTATPATLVADEVWLREARACGADLILETQLVYAQVVRSELNDRFWLNLPLFLLGGPFCWFVNDRSYYFDVRLRAELHDVSAASGAPTFDANSRIVRVDREASDASLDFLDRAGRNVGSYGLSFLIPAGLIAKESGEVGEELEEYVAERLSEDLSLSFQERSYEVNEPELVDFHPDTVRVAGDGPARFLEGQMVLEVGAVTDLGRYRYRLNGGEFVEASWGESTLDTSGRQPLRRYPFRIPVGELDSGTVQIEVRQEDREASARTFTYSIPSAEQE